MEMDKVFAVQVIVSFVVGGGLVSFLSLIAEKVPGKYAGMVLSLPSTVAISFLFLGWLYSPATVTTIAPSVVVSLGVMLVMIVVYVYAAQLSLKKYISIGFSTLVSVSVWFLLAFFIASVEFSGFFRALLYYAVFAAVALLMLKTKKGQQRGSLMLHYTLTQKIMRAIFAGAIIAFSLVLSKVLGPRWGGVISVFPASFLSTLVIYHWYHERAFLFSIGQTTPVGSLILLTYVVVAGYTFNYFGTIGGTMLAYLTSIVVFFILVFGTSREKKQDAC